MRIATWNVNSVRARADRVEAWLQRSDVDVLAMQETKAKDDNFPWELFEYMGYDVAHFGLSQWNGVAIASRVGLEDVEDILWDLDQALDTAVNAADAAFEDLPQEAAGEDDDDASASRAVGVGA